MSEASVARSSGEKKFVNGGVTIGMENGVSGDTETVGLWLFELWRGLGPFSDDIIGKNIRDVENARDCLRERVCSGANQSF